MTALRPLSDVLCLFGPTWTKLFSLDLTIAFNRVGRATTWGRPYGCGFAY